jgi:hypothetical protein
MPLPCGFALYAWGAGDVGYSVPAVGTETLTYRAGRLGASHPSATTLAGAGSAATTATSSAS